MRRRWPPTSVSPNSFDPTFVNGAPKPGRPGGPGGADLAVDGPVVQKTSTWAMRPDDKVVMDALQSWYHVRHGRQLTQWELFTRVLAAALSHPEGEFVGALEAIEDD